jgi:hypothetical protein
LSLAAAALPRDRDLSGGPGRSGVCPGRNAPVFLDDDVSPPAPALRGAIVTRDERLVSTAALKPPKYYISVIPIADLGQGLADQCAGRGLEGTLGLISERPLSRAKWCPYGQAL